MPAVKILSTVQIAFEWPLRTTGDERPRFKVVEPLAIIRISFEMPRKDIVQL